MQRTKTNETKKTKNQKKTKDQNNLINCSDRSTVSSPESIDNFKSENLSERIPQARTERKW